MTNEFTTLDEVQASEWNGWHLEQGSSDPRISPQSTILAEQGGWMLVEDGYGNVTIVSPTWWTEETTKWSGFSLIDYVEAHCRPKNYRSGRKHFSNFVGEARDPETGLFETLPEVIKDHFWEAISKADQVLSDEATLQTFFRLEVEDFEYEQMELPTTVTE